MTSDGGSGADAGSGGEIYRLVYLSTSVIPSLDDGGDREIQNILDVARRVNPTLGVTGALTFNDFHFAQALEGRRADVEALFARIRRDWRHRDVLVLQEEWISRRDFPDWSMAYVGEREAVTIISPQSRLREIATRPHGAAAALIEMMKFFLLADFPRG